MQAEALETTATSASSRIVLSSPWLAAADKGDSPRLAQRVGSAPNSTNTAATSARLSCTATPRAVPPSAAASSTSHPASHRTRTTSGSPPKTASISKDRPRISQPVGDRPASRRMRTAGRCPPSTAANITPSPGADELTAVWDRAAQICGISPFSAASIKSSSLVSEGNSWHSAGRPRQGLATAPCPSGESPDHCCSSTQDRLRQLPS
mmetsp:Transcript_17173/g.39272  ORF Transcript_17173/g.39272 Transcript_17173/m.39272 type:complete len:208 (-) Transcript_17173:102-725(-)